MSNGREYTEEEKRISMGLARCVEMNEYGINALNYDKAVDFILADRRRCLNDVARPLIKRRKEIIGRGVFTGPDPDFEAIDEALKVIEKMKGQ